MANARFTRNINLLGLQITTNSSGPDLFAYYLFNFDLDFPNEQTPPRDMPLLDSAGRIVFFRSAASARREFTRLATGIHLKADAPTSITSLISVVDVIKILAMLDADENNTVVDFLNLLFDCLIAISDQLDAEAQNILHLLADHLTFQPDFAEFLKNYDVRRSQLIGYLFDAVARIAMHSVIIEAD